MREHHQTPATPQACSEQETVHRAQAGDSDAFAQLYEKYFDKIYRYAFLRLGNKADAEDLTEQVFLKALESIGNYRWRGMPFSSWLFRIAHNLVVDLIRRRSRAEMAPLIEAIPSKEPGPLELVELKVTLQELAAAIKRLTEAQRQVISFRFAGELSSAEVAAIMGKSEGAVKALQHSALVTLRRCLAGSPA
ncbi:MAG: sigma-70 family RNA polymerase sigma factor [Chloroflexi bacterium]|nr:sigma-70 family RNA polymerase sigma factor [Chloroflexota bacterium]